MRFIHNSEVLYIMKDQFSFLNEDVLNNEIDVLKESYKLSTTPNDIYKLIDAIDLNFNKIDTNLNHFVTLKLKNHQQDLNNIELNRVTKLSNTISNSNELLNIFQVANDLGNSLTFKIKSLDEEIGNVNETLNFLLDVQVIRNNISQINYCIEHKDWETASKCIHDVRKISPLIVDGKFSSSVIPSTDIPELPADSIDTWCKKLTEVFKEGFLKASNDRNVEELTKYFQLFPLIGREEVGLECYSKFICQVIEEMLKGLISDRSRNETNTESYPPGAFSTISSQLFENISLMLSQHTPLIKRYYEPTYPNSILAIITKIQYEIDSQINIISDTFYDVRRIEKLLQDINLYKFPLLTFKGENEEPKEVVLDNNLISLVDVGDFINELATIFHNWLLYCKFITFKYFKEKGKEISLSDLSLTDVSDSSTSVPSIITNSNFTKKVAKKYQPTFEILYSFYLRRGLEKSIMIEELPSLETFLQATSATKSFEVPCSSVIEDLTLILHNTLQNVIDCGILSTFKTFISKSFEILQQDLINNFLIRNLNENQPRYNQVLSIIKPGYVSMSPGNSRSNTPDPGLGFFKGASSALGNVVGTTAASENSDKLLKFIIYLNTVAMSQEYFERIINNVRGGRKTALNLTIAQNGHSTTISSQIAHLRSSFPFEKDAEKVNFILTNDFLTPFISITNKIISDSIVNVYNQSFKTRLVILINEFLPENETNYIIYSSTISDTSSLLKLSTTWQSMIRPYQQTLHRTLIFEKFLRLVVVNLANLLEKKIHLVLKKFRINELGSIRLEKDLSYFINEVCQDNYLLREKFLRVTQLVLLVGMDDEEYEESLQHANQSKNSDDEEHVEDEFLGINWVLTPQERNMVRRYRA